MARDEGDTFTTLPIAGFLALGLLSQSDDTPENQPPTASFEYSTDDVVGSITAESASSDPETTITSHEWELVQGGSVIETATGNVATFTVPDKSAQYTVRLTVEDTGGLTDTAEQTGIGPFDFQPPESGPTADFTWSLEPRDKPNFTILAVDATASQAGDAPIASYEWSIPGVVVLDNTPTYRASMEHGTYNVGLTVEDENGNTDSVTKQVVVEPVNGGGGNGSENTPPTAQFSWDVQPHDSQYADLHLDASPSSDPDGSISEYHFVITQNGTHVGDRLSKTYAVRLEHGTYTVELTVTDDAGASTTETKQVDVTGDGGGGNGGVTAVASASVDGSTITLDASGSSGPISTYSWSVYDSGGALVASRGGETATVENVPAGSYPIDLTVTGDSGSVDGDSTAVTVQGDGQQFERRMVVSSASGVAAPSGSFVDMKVSDGATVLSGNASVADDGKSIVYTPDGNPAEIAFDGSIDLLHWQGFTLDLEVDGTRRDPFELAFPGESGPRKLWIPDDLVNPQVMEMTIYTTLAVYNDQGWTPARTVANFVSGSLREHGVPHDICFDLGPVEVPSHDTGCPDPNEPTTAYEFWHGQLNGGHGDVNGDTFSTRKDANLLLTNFPGGGCGAVGGNVSVVGVRGLMPSSIREWPGPPATETESNGIYPAMHETGHNLGYGHPGDGSMSGGRGWYDGNQFHHTPCSVVPGNTNVCGVETPQRHNQESGVTDHLHYTDCTISEIFLPGIGGGYTGNTSSISQGRGLSGDCPACQPAGGTVDHLY